MVQIKLQRPSHVKVLMLLQDR